MQNAQTRKDLEKIVDMLEERIFELDQDKAGARRIIPLLTLKAITRGVILVL